ncbi:MAG: hypothetical protein OXU46_08710, partial [Candidatus Marinimicrobia bacterium]|nr:hypothetical protein [Candidatus Neomarinimicrobiota bacterium]
MLLVALVVAAGPGFALPAFHPFLLGSPALLPLFPVCLDPVYLAPVLPGLCFLDLGFAPAIDYRLSADLADTLNIRNCISLLYPSGPTTV